MTKFMCPQSEAAAADALEALANGRNRDPFAVLGPHQDGRGATIVRAFQPAARSIDIRRSDASELLPMAKVCPAAVSEAVTDSPPAADRIISITACVSRFPITPSKSTILIAMAAW